MEKDNIQLSPVERQLLINQYKILDKLSEGEGTHKDYQNKIEALSSGYELHYQDALEDVQEDTLSTEQCKEILDILEMFRGIIYSYQALERENKLKELTRKMVHFEGFDGNNETSEMFYVRYFIKDLERYSEIEEFSGKNADYNSHAHRLPTYRRMLSKWNNFRHTLPNPYLMTEDQIKELITGYNPMW